MTYKTLLTALLITTTSYSPLKTERAKIPSLFTKTYSKVICTVQRLIKYFHKHVWTSWSKKSLFLLILGACITADGMSSRVLFPLHMAQKKKQLSISAPPSSIQSLDDTHVKSTQPRPQLRIPVNKNFHLYDSQSPIVPIDSPRSVASEEKNSPHPNSNVMAQVALGAVATFASGRALEILRSRLQLPNPQPTSPAVQEACSSSEEPVYGPLYPTDIALINSLPQAVRQLLVSFIKGPFKLFHEQHRSPQQETIETSFYTSPRYLSTHTEEALAFIDNEHIKFLSYREANFPKQIHLSMPLNQCKPTTTCCSFVQIYIGPDKPKEGLISKTVTPCKSYLPLNPNPDEGRFPKPLCAPEEHRISIYAKPSHEKKYLSHTSFEGEHYLYESTIGDVSRFGDGSRRVFPKQPALWFVPFKTFLAIYEEITPRTPRHHIIDEENYPHPPEIPIIIHSRCHKPHQLIQLIKAAHNIEALTVPLAQGDTYQKRLQIVPEEDYPYHDFRTRRRYPPPPVIPAVPSTASSINIFAFNFDRNTQGNRNGFGFLGSLELTGEEIKKERYITYPTHTGPDRELVEAYAEPEDIECVIYKRRAHSTDYDIIELFQQVTPPPPAPELTRLQKIHTVLMPPPPKERLEIKF